MFPEYPPYESDHDDVVPYLTIAFRYKRKWKKTEKDLTEKLGSTNGIAVDCDSVSLFKNSRGKWEEPWNFSLVQ